MDEVGAHIAKLGDWRGDMLAAIRRTILTVDPDVVEEIKWRKPSNPDGVPTYTHGKLICTLEHYKDKVTFTNGGAVLDPAGLFNQGTGVRRAIDIREGDDLDTEAFGRLFLAAVEAS